MIGTTDYIREIEANKLDVEFKKYQLVNLKDDISIPHILKIYGDIHREFETYGLSNFVGRRQLYVFLQSVGHCLRWIASQKGDVSSNDLKDEDLHDFSLNLLLWGREYTLIANQFIAWSRGLIDVKIDISNKEIEFFPPNEDELYFGYQQDLSSDEIMFDFYTFIPFEEMHKIYQEWINELNLSQPPIIINWNLAKDHEIANKFQKQLAKIVFNEIDENTDLGGYTIKEYIIFYSNLFINFHFIETIEDYIDKQTDYVNAFGSNPLSLPQADMIQFLVEMTGLSTTCIENILSDLVFNTNNFHSSMTNQPFVVSSTNEFYILPRIFANIEPERMLIGALNKSPTKKKIYDNLINPIEKVNIDKVILMFVNYKNSLTIFREKRFSKRGRIITPDLIIIDSETREVLVCDYKHFITPISTSETVYRIKESQKGIEQVAKYIDFIKSDNFLNLEDDFSYFGLLLSRNPLPIPLKIRDNINVTDNNTIFRLLDSVGNFTELINTLSNRNDLKLSKKDFFFEDIKTKVDDWTFIRKIYAAD